MVISDLFWLTTLKFFLHYHPDYEKHESILETRIAKNYINFMIRVDDKFEGDKFFKRYFDILAQAIFYSLFYAFPKSRNKFNDELKHKLIEFYSEKFTGIKISNSFVSSLFRCIMTVGAWIWAQEISSNWTRTG